MDKLPEIPIDGVSLRKQGMQRAEIRYLTEGDLFQAKALQREIAAATPSEIYHVAPEADWYEQRFADSLYIGVFLPEAAGEEQPLIALLRVYLGENREYGEFLGYPHEMAMEMADVDDVLVRGEYRGNGLQRLLLELAEAVCASVGQNWLLASVAPGNPHSLRNFLRQGYLIEGKYPLYGGERYIVKKGIGKMEEKRALLLIDYTYDFVADEGKLTAGAAAQAIEGAVARRVRTALDEGQEIFVLNDIHYPDDKDHPESKLFPPHNLAGSSGRELYGKVKNAVDEAENAAPERLHRMDKTRYSAFVRTGLEAMLRERGVSQVQLAGVCTDICILHSAIDAYNLGFDIVVSADEVASFNPEGHAFALAHFKNVLGATVID